MKYPIICIVMLAGLLLSSIAQAQTSKVSYTTIDVAYQGSEFDSSFGDVDGDGFRGAGSLALHKNWHVFGGYESNQLDDFVVDVNGTPTTFSPGDLNIWNVGLGINTDPRGGGTNMRTRNTLDRYSLFMNGQYTSIARRRAVLRRLRAVEPDWPGSRRPSRARPPPYASKADWWVQRGVSQRAYFDRPIS